MSVTFIYNMHVHSLPQCLVSFGCSKYDEDFFGIEASGIQAAMRKPRLYPAFFFNFQ